MAGVDEILKALNKKYGEGTIVRASEATSMILERIPSGSLAIDIVMGGGIPENRVTLLVGNRNTGKTSIALHIVAQFQIKMRKTIADGGKKKVAVWIDAEGVFVPAWAESIGVDTDELLVVRPEYGEQALDIADAFVKSNECGLIVLDSLASLVPQAEAEESMEKLFMGDAAKMNNKFFRKLTGGMNAGSLKKEADKGPTVVLINQWREKIGVMYGSPNTLPGGLGQGFTASVILEIKRGDWIEEKVERYGVESKEIVGQWIKVFGEKNKTATPKKTGQVRFLFQDTPGVRAGHFDTIEEVVRYASFYQLIERRGAYYHVKGIESNFQGMASLVEFLRSRPEIIESLYAQLLVLLFQGDGKPPEDEALRGSIEGSETDVITLDVIGKSSE